MNDVSSMELLLRKIARLKKETGISRTIFAACPNSMAVIRASLRSAKRNNAPIKFAATLNQVLASRSKLYRNLRLNGIDAEEVLLLRIERAMDKYFHKFNLVGLNDLIMEEEMEMVRLMS